MLEDGGFVSCFYIKKEEACVGNKFGNNMDIFDGNDKIKNKIMKIVQKENHDYDRKRTCIRSHQSYPYR